MTWHPLIPNPIASEEQAARWYHHDLDEVDRLTPRALWAERLIIELELARRIVGSRPRIVHVERDGTPVLDQEWLENRARRLRAAERRPSGR